VACNCGGKKRVSYQVKFRDGRQETFVSSADASNAIRAAGGGTMKAVPVK